MAIQMATAYRALIALVLLSCSQEFTNAAHSNINDSSRGDIIRLPDSGPNTIPSDSPLDIRTPEASRPLPPEDSGFDSQGVVLSDSMVDATQSPENDAGQRNPEDSGREAALPKEAGNPPTYCIDCQPQFGRPPCCNAYKQCGYINGLNVCTGPTR